VSLRFVFGEIIGVREDQRGEKGGADGKNGRGYPCWGVEKKEGGRLQKIHCLISGGASFDGKGDVGVIMLATNKCSVT